MEAGVCMWERMGAEAGRYGGSGRWVCFGRWVKKMFWTVGACLGVTVTVTVTVAVWVGGGT